MLSLSRVGRPFFLDIVVYSKRFRCTAFSSTGLILNKENLSQQFGFWLFTFTYLRFRPNAGDPRADSSLPIDNLWYYHWIWAGKNESRKFFQLSCTIYFRWPCQEPTLAFFFLIVGNNSGIIPEVVSALEFSYFWGKKPKQAINWDVIYNMLHPFSSLLLSAQSFILRLNTCLYAE